MHISPKSSSLTTRYATAAGVILMILASSTIADVDSARGEALYKNHCGTCHDNNVHKREDRRVKSMEELRTWVEAMSAHTGLDWLNEDIGDVAFYLSLRIYQFEE